MTSVEWALTAAALGAICGALGARSARPRARVPSAPAAPELPAENAPRSAALARLMRALPIGVVLVDRRYRVELANPAAAAIFGFDAERAFHAHVIEAIANVGIERRIGDALGGEASVAPLTLGGPRGRRIYRVSTYPLTDANGEPQWVVVFAEEQTALVRLERARKEFLSNVSHELRTPLSSIKLMLETVAAVPEREARDTFLPQALGQVDRLSALVDQLLEQARAESGQLRLDWRDVDLEKVAHPIVASFEPRAANKGVCLQLLPLRPVRVEADPDRLAQVFVNLIDNAIRHTPSGGRVAIELDARGSEAIVRVRDTGEGIPYRDVPRIFERFYTVDRSRRRQRGEGAGLGLAIVKGIIDAHGGAVSAESALGRGTTFTLRLPIVRVKREA